MLLNTRKYHHITNKIKLLSNHQSTPIYYNKHPFTKGCFSGTGAQKKRALIQLLKFLPCTFSMWVL